MSGSDFKTNLNKFASINYDTNVMEFGGPIQANSITAQSFSGNVSSTMPTTASIDIKGNVTGNSVVSNTIIANTFSGNLIGNGALLTGVVSSLPSKANIDIIGNVRSSGNLIVGGQISTGGNVSANYFFANGALLTGVNVLPTKANIDIVGNVIAPGNVIAQGQVNIAGNVSANYFVGNGALMSGILTSLPTRANIDIVGNVLAPGNVIVQGQVNAVGNVTGNYFLGNGILLQGIVTTFPNQANIDITGNVVSPGNVFALSQVTVVGNVAASYFIGNGSSLSGILTSLPNRANIDITGNVASLGNIVVQGQVTVVGNMSANYFVGNGALLQGVLKSLPGQANIDIVGNVNAPGNVFVQNNLSIVGNVTAAYFIGDGRLLSNINTVLPQTGPGDITGNVSAPGNILVQGQVTVVGNVSSRYFIANGALLSGVLTSLPTSANIDIVGNVFAPGNIIVLGQVTAVGNVTGNCFLGNGSTMDGVLKTLPARANIDIVGNVTAPGNIIASGQVTVLGNVYSSYLFGNGALLTNVSSTLPPTANTNLIGNVTSSGNLRVTGQVDVDSLTATNYYFGNGKFLTGVVNTIIGVQNVDIIGNVIASGNVSVAGQVNFTTFAAGQYLVGNGAFVTSASAALPGNANTDIVGNVIAPGNILVSGFLTAAGNVSATYFQGNGSLLTGLNPVLPSTLQRDVIGNVVAPGNVFVSGQLTSVGNTVATYFIGNGSTLSGVISALPPIVNLTVTNGNVSGTFANVQNVRVLIGDIANIGNVIFFGGNITSNNIIGNGYFIDGILKTFPSAASVDVLGNATSNVIITNSLLAGNLNVGRSLIVGGNIVAGSFAGNGSNVALAGLLLKILPDVADQSARLALTTPNGSLVKQTDSGIRYILTQQPPSVDSNWLIFTGASISVVSLYNNTGSVFPGIGDYTDATVGLSAAVGDVPASQSLATALYSLEAGRANITTSGVIPASFRGNFVSTNADATNVVTSILRINGNLTGNTLNASGNITGNYFIGNGIFITGVTQQLASSANVNIIGNIVTPGGGNVFVGGQANLNMTGNGNLFARTFIGNMFANTMTTDILISNVILWNNGGFTSNANVIANVLNPVNFTSTSNMSSRLFIANNVISSGNILSTNVTALQLIAASNPGNLFVIGNVVGQDMWIGGNVTTFGNNVTFSNNVILGYLSNAQPDDTIMTPLMLDLRSNAVSRYTTAPRGNFGSMSCVLGLEGTMVIRNGVLYRSGIGYANNYFQIFGYSESNYTLNPVTLIGGPSTRIVDVKYNFNNVIALTSTGEVWNWGYTCNPLDPLYNPVKIALPSSGNVVAKIFAPTQRAYGGANGQSQYAAVLSNGQMYMWGLNESYQCGDGTTTYSLTPRIPTGLSAIKVVKVAMSTTFSGSTFALSDTGALYRWGNNSSGELGTGNVDVIKIPITSSGISASGVADVAFSGGIYYAGSQVNRTSSRILLTNGTSYGSGCNVDGELGIGTVINTNTFIRESTNRSNIAAIGTVSCLSNNAHYIVQTDGQILFSGARNLFVSTPATAALTFTAPSGGFQYNMLPSATTGIVPRIQSACSPLNPALYYYSTVGLLDNTGNLYGLGYNTNGQLGTGTAIPDANIYPFTLLNQYMPGNARVADFLMNQFVNRSGGTIVSLTDGTMMCVGNTWSGSIPIAVAPPSYGTTGPLYIGNNIPVPYWTYVPGFGPQNQY